MRSPNRSYALVFLLLSALLASSCLQNVVVTPEVIAVQKPAITLDPDDAVWDDLSVHVSPLLLQDLVDPRLMQPSTKDVSVKAITDGKEIAFRLEWIDKTPDDMPGQKHFIDSCAVQLPSQIDAVAPAPQMGETGKPVEITFWRSDWQATVDGRPDSIKSIYPNAAVDHYPAEARSLENNPAAKQAAGNRYSPAAALGNRRSGPRDQPVEDLIAEGPGTLAPAPNSFSRGKGTLTKDGWAVVIARPMPNGLSAANPGQVAFAVWEGSHGEAGARKMRTGWVTLLTR